MPTIPPPDIPSNVPPPVAAYLRTLRTWAQTEFDKRTGDTEASPHNLMLAPGAPGAKPKAYKFQVDQDGIASLAPMALGTADPAGTGTPVPLVNEAPTDGGLYGRSNSGWTAALPASGGALTGPLTAPSATITGALTAGSATISGALSAGATTLTAALNGTTATLTGALNAASAMLTGALSLTGLLSGAAATFTGLVTVQSQMFSTLPPNAANDAAAATAGVPVGGVYRNGSVLMVRTV